MKEERTTVWQIIGMIIFALTALPASELAGFGGFFNFSEGWSLETCLAFSAVGGALGGALIAEKHYIAGYFGGLIAGPCGFLAVYFYLLNGKPIVPHKLLPLIQLAGSLPGIGLYYVLKRLGSPADEAELAFIEEKPFDAAESGPRHHFESEASSRKVRLR